MSAPNPTKELYNTQKLALKKSIKHWKEDNLPIASSLGNIDTLKLGPYNCPCCEKFQLPTLRSRDCMNCPIYLFSCKQNGTRYCIGTPYQKVSRHNSEVRDYWSLTDDGGKTLKEIKLSLLDAVKEEIEFLENIYDKYYKLPYSKTTKFLK